MRDEFRRQFAWEMTRAERALGDIARCITNTKTSTTAHCTTSSDITTRFHGFSSRLHNYRALFSRPLQSADRLAQSGVAEKLRCRFESSRNILKCIGDAWRGNVWISLTWVGDAGRDAVGHILTWVRDTRLDSARFAWRLMCLERTRPRRAAAGLTDDLTMHFAPCNRHFKMRRFCHYLILSILSAIEEPAMTRAILVLLFLAAMCWAQPPKPPEKQPGDDDIAKWLAGQTQKLSQKFLDGAKNKDEWEKKLPRLKQEYFAMLGLWPLPEKTPLNSKITGTIERGNVVIDKLHFQSKPGLYVTGNLYRPQGNDKKLPTILYVCGHSGRGRDGNKTAFQDHGMWFASNGYNCLAIDTLQLGEVAGKHHGTYNLNRWWWQAAGYTPAGVECWNGVRAIDYLATRSDVDVDRIGVTGISGGGAATIWIAAADERVKVAVPVSGMSDLESYVTNRIINGHCDCMLMINTYQWEWTTIAALIAPRPMLFANSDNDPIFPMDRNRRIAERLRSLYGMYGKAELFDEYVSKGGHDYRPDLRVAIFKFINKHLRNEAGVVTDAKFEPLPGKDLRVFAEDSDLPKDQLNDRIDETFAPRAKVELPEPGKFDDWKKALMKELRSKSFRSFPDRIPKAHLPDRVSDPNNGWMCTTEPGFRARVTWEDGDVKKPVTFVVRSWNDAENGVPAWASEERFPGEVFCISPRGHGPTRWTRKNPPNYVERSHALLGRTVEEGRVWDIIAAFRDFHAVGGDKKWQITGESQGGILAAYAALFEQDIPEIVLLYPPASHRDGPVFLNVLQVLDIPEMLGMLAPRPLTIVSKNPAFDRTAEIYKRAGAADKFKRLEK